MNLYEFEGKNMFEHFLIQTPIGVNLRRGDDIAKAYAGLDFEEVVVKAQVLSGKRGKNNGIKYCSTFEEVEQAVKTLFETEILGQYVSAVRIEEKLHISEEHYLSISYDTNTQQPVVVYSKKGGVDIEDVDEEDIITFHLGVNDQAPENTGIPFLAELWKCFLYEDCRVAEINPLVKTVDGSWIAADAKIVLDDDAFYRHTTEILKKETTKGRVDWESFESRTMLGRPPTEREIAVQNIDKGEKYYQGTAGKYIEMDGDIAILFSGGGASIANMDALQNEGLQAANYTEYSGNPPREKVYQLTKIVLSKPGLRGLWIAGGVANFTNIKDTFQGIIDALDEVKPSYPIVVRRAGPYEKEGMQLMRECAEQNNLNMQLFGKEMSMSESAKVLANAINNSK